MVLGIVLYGASGPRNWLGLALAVLLGVASFAGLGFGAASLIRSSEGSSAVVQLIVLPMAFLSGSFGPTRSYPAFLQAVADVLPLTYLIRILKVVYLAGGSSGRSPGGSWSSSPGVSAGCSSPGGASAGSRANAEPPRSRGHTLLRAPMVARADRNPLGRPGAVALPAVPTPSAGSLPDMQSRARPLGTAALVAEAVDHAGLRRVLDRGGYVAGNEREFFGTHPVFDHVTERVLRFETGSGASSYLRWLRAHTAESLGAPRSVTPLDIGTEGFRFRPRGCGCHSETPTYLVAWRRGPLALTVLASGGGASAKTVGALARALDAS